MCRKIRKNNRQNKRNCFQLVVSIKFILKFKTHLFTCLGISKINYKLFETIHTPNTVAPMASVEFDSGIFNPQLHTEHTYRSACSNCFWELVKYVYVGQCAHEFTHLFRKCCQAYGQRTYVLLYFSAIHIYQLSS